MRIILILISLYSLTTTALSQDSTYQIKIGCWEFDAPSNWKYEIDYIVAEHGDTIHIDMSLMYTLCYIYESQWIPGELQIKNWGVDPTDTITKTEFENINLEKQIAECEKYPHCCGGSRVEYDLGDSYSAYTLKPAQQKGITGIFTMDGNDICDLGFCFNLWGVDLTLSNSEKLIAMIESAIGKGITN
jgi:hypothetical protein